MPDQRLPVESHDQTGLGSSYTNRQGCELPLCLLVWSGGKVDLPGRHRCCAAVADISRADVFVAVRGIVSGIKNAGEQTGVEALPVHVIPFVQVIGCGRRSDGGSIVNNRSVGRRKILPVIPIAPVFTIILNYTVPVVSRVMAVPVVVITV